MTEAISQQQYVVVPKKPLLQRAIEKGYIVKGWGVEDYIRDAVTTRGWECYIIHGRLGSYKSNFMMQLLYSIYQDWDTVLDRIIFTPKDFIKITQETDRIPMLGHDDISAHMPRTLYTTNRKLWASLAKNWDLFRPKLNVFICTAPRKGRVASFIVDGMTGELFCYSQRGENRDFSLYTHQRWMWETDFKDYTRDIGRPVNVEDNVKILRENVPTEVFKKYWKRRMELTIEAHKELIDLYENLESEGEVDVGHGMKMKVKREYTAKDFEGLPVKDIRSICGRTQRMSDDHIKEIYGSPY